MPSVIRRSTFRNYSDLDTITDRTELIHSFTSTGETDYEHFAGTIVVQVAGTGETELIVQRSTSDPEGGSPNWSPAEDIPFVGDLSQGISPRVYSEPFSAWWRVLLVTYGGPCTVSIIGRLA